MSEPLLGAELIRELEAMRRRLEIRARSGAAGELASRRRGGSAEFQEHRAYEPGDDLRRVDWLAYARTGQPVLKLFRAEEDAVCRLLVDGSSSLDFGDPRKHEVAKRLAAAIGYVSLAGAQRAQVLGGGAPPSSTQEAGIGWMGSPRRGRGGLGGLLRDLDGLSPRGSLSLARAIDDVMRRSTRPGMLVVLSDFFDAGPFTSALTRARAAGHDIFLIQVVDRTEIEPSFEGDYALEDAETGASVDVTMDPAAIDAYVLRFAGLVEELRVWARKNGATYVRAVTDEPLEAAVRRVVARTVD